MGEDVGVSSPEDDLTIDTEFLVDLTCALVEAPSENPGGTEGQAVAVLENACQALGFDIETIEVDDDRPNLVATLPGGPGPGLMFLGHSDVVPAGGGWTGDPYIARVVDGRIIGRGSADMKGGLAAIVTSMAALSRRARTGRGLAGPVTLVCTVDEEEHGSGARDFVSRSRPGSYLGCVVAEPTDLSTVIACRGASYIEITVTGRAAHSGRPSDGRSAINAAARIIDLIVADHDAMQQTLDPLLGAGTWNVGTISGGQGISIVAPICELGSDRRLMPEENAGDIAQWLRDRIRAEGIDSDGIEVDVRLTMEMPGFATPADHRLPVTAVAALADLGVDSPITGWTAACDGGYISRDLGISPIVLGPGNINEQAHKPDESVAIDDLVTAARAYADMAIRLVG
ncbi:M20 family metallopeptidase [Gordonia jinhuaensis]|uniref:M20 family metallopeptidase n=1 Tax=Gordonia jinhuaensis TaxID=1517702 RepID=UPI001664C9DC|nr:M20 family metallopeptidase [Gordonia jinhuaensis]